MQEADRLTSLLRRREEGTLATRTSCSREIPDGHRFCGFCGSPIETATSAPTRSTRAAGAHPSLEIVRFLPGAVLAGRYPIISLPRRPVALKFPPAAVEKDRARLDGFFNEVEIARQGAHPNVCRDHDVGSPSG